MLSTNREPRLDLVICGAEYEIRESTSTISYIFGHILAIITGICFGFFVLPILVFFPRFWCMKFGDDQVSFPNNFS
jgi:hypothetical protein